MTQVEDRAGTQASAGQAERLEVRIARELLDRAKTKSVSLVGAGGLLAGVKKTVLQSTPDVEMADHLVCQRRAAAALLLHDQPVSMRGSRSRLWLRRPSG